MIKSVLAASTLAATTVLGFATAAPAHAVNPTVTPAWIGPTATGGPAGFAMDPVTTSTGSVRGASTVVNAAADDPLFNLSFQRYTAAGWATAFTVDQTDFDPSFDSPAMTADATNVRFVEPYYNANGDEALKYVVSNGTSGGTTRTNLTNLGTADTPELGTDTAGNSMVLGENGANDDVLVAQHITSAGVQSAAVTLQASNLLFSKVVATGTDTFLAVWSQGADFSHATIKYATYSPEGWAPTQTLSGATDPFVANLVSTSDRQVLETIGGTGVGQYYSLTAAVWTATTGRTLYGPMTVAPDDTIYAGGKTLGTLNDQSTAWSTEGIAFPGVPTGHTCDDSTPSGFELVWDNAINGLRTQQNVLSGTSCESDTWVVGQRPTGTDIYTPVAPNRVLDTRVGLGAPKAAVGTGKSLTLSFAGKIPADATAVALNVTGTGGTMDTYVTGYPTGTTKPTASSLNLAKGQTAASLGLFKLGTNQSLTLFNYSGNLQLVGDLAGYESPSGLTYSPVDPSRVLDTRLGTGAAKAAVGAGKTITLNLTGIVPDSATAIALNLTGTDTTTSTYLAAYPAGSARPSASAVNIAQGETSTNLTLVKLGSNHSVTLFNYGGSTQIVGDLAGYYSPTSPTGFVSQAPSRVLDTRTGVGAAKGARGPATTFDLNLTGIVPAEATAVAIRITGVTPNHPSYISAYPSGQDRPSASSVNTTPGRATGNLVIVKLGANQSISLYEGIGTEHIVGDLVGYFR